MTARDGREDGRRVRMHAPGWAVACEQVALMQPRRISNCSPSCSPILGSRLQAGEQRALGTGQRRGRPGATAAPTSGAACNPHGSGTVSGAASYLQEGAAGVPQAGREPWRRPSCQAPLTQRHRPGAVCGGRRGAPSKGPRHALTSLLPPALASQQRPCVSAGFGGCRTMFSGGQRVRCGQVRAAPRAGVLCFTAAVRRAQRRSRRLPKCSCPRRCRQCDCVGGVLHMSACSPAPVP